MTYNTDVHPGAAIEAKKPRVLSPRIVESFTLSEAIVDIVHDGAHWWTLEHPSGSDPVARKRDPVDWSVLKSITLPPVSLHANGSNWPGGITVSSDGSLWYIEHANTAAGYPTSGPFLYRVDPDNGTVLNQFLWPVAYGAGQPANYSGYDLSWDGGHLWTFGREKVGTSFIQYMYKLSPFDGSIVGRWNPGFSAFFGHSWGEANHLWIIKSLSGTYSAQAFVDQVLRTSTTLPTLPSGPSGIEWVGDSLWVAGGTTVQRIDLYHEIVLVQPLSAYDPLNTWIQPVDVIKDHYQDTGTGVSTAYRGCYYRANNFAPGNGAAADSEANAALQLAYQGIWRDYDSTTEGHHRAGDGYNEQNYTFLWDVEDTGISGGDDWAGNIGGYFNIGAMKTYYVDSGNNPGDNVYAFVYQTAKYVRPQDAWFTPPIVDFYFNSTYRSRSNLGGRPANQPPAAQAIEFEENGESWVTPSGALYQTPGMRLVKCNIRCFSSVTWNSDQLTFLSTYWEMMDPFNTEFRIIPSGGFASIGWNGTKAATLDLPWKQPSEFSLYPVFTIHNQRFDQSSYETVRSPRWMWNTYHDVTDLLDENHAIGFLINTSAQRNAKNPRRHRDAFSGVGAREVGDAWITTYWAFRPTRYRWVAKSRLAEGDPRRTVWEQTKSVPTDYWG